MAVSTKNFSPELMSEWLKPGGSTVILCRNVVDIMRTRIFLHEILQPRKNLLFNVQFLTIDLWIRKLLPYAPTHLNIAPDNLHLKAVILESARIIQKKSEEPLLRELLDRPGFLAELPHLWQIYSWGKIFNPGSDDHNGLIENFFLELDRQIHSSGILPPNEFLAGKAAALSTIYNKPDQVIYFFPTLFNAVEDIKFRFLYRHAADNWKYILQGAAGMPNFTSSSPELNNKSNHAYKWIHDNSLPYELPENTRKVWLDQNRTFFSETENYLQTRIWMAKNPIDEFDLIARTARLLVESNGSPHKIFILYTRSVYLPLLEFKFLDYGMSLNYPEKSLAAARPVFSLFLKLIELFRLKPGSSSLLRNQLIELTLSPVLATEIPPDEMKSRRQMGRLIYEHFRIDEEIVLESGAVKNKELPHEVADLLAQLGKFSRQIGARKTFHEKVSTLLEITHHLIYPGVRNQSDIADQFQQIQKLCERVAGIGNLLRREVDTDFLFEILFSETANLKIKSRAESARNNRLPEIYARSITEGIHSPVDYLLVCGLSSTGYPVISEHPHIFRQRQSRNLNIELTPEDQIRKFNLYLPLVKKGMCLTFNLDNDTSPSDLVFDHISVDEKNHDKNEIIASLPFYSDNESFPPFQIHHNLAEPGTSNYNDEIVSLSFKSRHELLNRESADRLEYRNFTGQVSPLSTDRISKSSTLENMASCPQMVYFERILGLKEYQEYDKVRFPSDQIFKGELFHHVLKIWTQHLIEKYPAETYGSLARIFYQDFPGQIRDFFQAAQHHLAGKFRQDYRSLSNSLISAYYDQISDYFRKFFFDTKNGSHPLSQSYPVAAELDFPAMEIGPFVLKGKIDRIDYCPSSQTIHITDFKTGKRERLKTRHEDIVALKSFQIPLYMKAAIALYRQGRILKSFPAENISGGYDQLGVDYFANEYLPIELFPGDTTFAFKDVEEKFEGLFTEKLAVLKNILDTGYMFSYGHKKGSNPSDPWEPPCSFCDFTEICDRSPYSVMKNRLMNDPLAKRYIEVFDPF